MKREPKTVKKVVNIMTNPNPEFVSLVGHPANQAPFKAVRLDPKAIERLAQAEASAELAVRTSLDTVEVHRFLFDKNVFKSEETVRSYLDTRNWTDYSVKDSGKYYEVPNLDADQFEGDLEDIPAQTGLTMSVGRLKATRAAPEPRTEVLGTPVPEAAPATVVKGELVKRYDAWYAAWSNGTTMKDVMVDGYDGLPPGFWEVADAYFTALRNNLVAKDTNAVRTLSNEWTEIVLRLVEVFKDLTPEQVERMTTQPNASEPAAKSAADTATPPAATTPETPPVVTPATSATPPATQDAPNAEAPKDGKETDEQNTGDLADVVAKAVRGALGTSLVDALKPVTDKIDASTAETTSLKDEVAKLSSRIDAVEVAQRQSRKSADIEDTVAPGSGEPITKSVDPEKAKREARRIERQREGMLGI